MAAKHKRQTVEVCMQEFEYLSADETLEEKDAETYQPEYLNTLQPSGLPPHRLVLKEGHTCHAVAQHEWETGPCQWDHPDL